MIKDAVYKPNMVQTFKINRCGIPMTDEQIFQSGLTGKRQLRPIFYDFHATRGTRNYSSQGKKRQKRVKLFVRQQLKEIAKF